MSSTQDTQAYDYSTLQWALGPDGLTHIKAPTGQLIATVAWFPIPDGNLDKTTIDRLITEWRAGPGGDANQVICSKCHDMGNYGAWNPTPANLKVRIH
ncbi:unnamed protein product [Rhizoctonia solani]|uniref:Uncharacterized protein n=1 Tax=Rhizoctonia solani TaxID=456999 RepID=A0A8H2Y2L6_9AGAM